jgi:hypothetical protein
LPSRREGKSPVREADASKRAETAERAENIPYDRVLALVRTGEKVLKNAEPAIKIERE